MRTWLTCLFFTAFVPVAAATSTWTVLPFDFANVAQGIYAFNGIQADMDGGNQGYIANIAFIVGSDCVAVIDTGGSAREGLRFKGKIQDATNLPICYVIYTHVHPDHIFGASAFAVTGTTFVGHAKLPNELAARGDYYLRTLDRMITSFFSQGTKIVEPTLLIAADSDIDLDLGGRVIMVHAHGTAHTDTDLSVYDKQTKTLFAGDLLFVDRIPSLDGSVAGWLKELDYLKRIPAARVVPGHGPVSVPWPQAAEPEIRYLTALETQVRTAIKQGVGIAKASTTLLQEERKNWLLFDDYNAHNITVAYKAMEWE